MGLKITLEKSLLYQLFTDDTALFIQNYQKEFDQAMNAIRMFKKASDVSLNVGKSVIIPMTHPISEDWCIWIGYKILQAHETTKYLIWLPYWTPS